MSSTIAGLSSKQRDQLSHEVRVPCLETMDVLERRRKALKRKKKKKRFAYSGLGKKRRQVKTDGKEYWAEALRETRINVECDLVYLVKWDNYPEHQNTWQASQDLFQCETLYDHFYKQQFVRHDRTVEYYSRDDLQRIHDVLRHLLTEDCDLLLLLTVNDMTVEEFADKQPKVVDLKRNLSQYKDAAYRQLRRKAVDDQDWPTRLLVLHLAGELHCWHYESLDEFLDFCDKRLLAKKKLNKWKEAMGVTDDKNALMHVQNLHDNCIPPSITFINSYSIDPELEANLKRTWEPWECACDDDCTRTKCVCALLLYTHNRKYKTSNVVYECTDTCRCNPDRCPNRRIQAGPRVKVTVDRTRGRGWGLMARQNIKYGQYVMEYLGEVLDSKGTRDRDNTYFFNLNDEFCGRTLFVDGRRFGTVARFANHSCEPNMDVHLAFCSPNDVIPRIAFFAKRDIKCGEELTYDYMRSVLTADSSGQFRNRDDRSDSGYQSDAEDSGRQTAVSQRPCEYFECRCGAKKCRKFI